LFLKKAVILTFYLPAVRRRPAAAARYLLFDRETSNFTYDIANIDDLINFFAAALSVDESLINGYVSELEQDDLLRSELNAGLLAKAGRNATARYGRRLGWYVLLRAHRPRVVIETGVHDGLGSSVLLTALQRNSREGSAGRLIGIDHDPNAGWLVPKRLAGSFTVHHEDSLTALRALSQDQKVDVFIHDSDHRYEHEMAEYAIVEHVLSAGAVLISDNAHECSALRDFSAEHNRVFFFWKEMTKNHFYPGAGIGMSLPPK
jgi:hypothetical protein